LTNIDNFSVFTSKFELGNIFENYKTYNNQGSSRISSTIFDLYNKSYKEENIDLVGQTLWKNECIINVPSNTRYSISTNIFFFKNGTIESKLNTFTPFNISNADYL
jgi:hypothetical protein